jgi:hypothetical protein
VRRSALFTSAACMLVLTACGPDEDEPQLSRSDASAVSEPAPLSAESSYASPEEVVAVLADVGVNCDVTTTSPDLIGCDAEGGHLIIYVEPRSASEERLAGHRRSPVGCGSATVPGLSVAARYLIGDGWMVMDTQGSPAIAAVESATDQRSSAVCSY